MYYFFVCQLGVYFELGVCVFEGIDVVFGNCYDFMQIGLCIEVDYGGYQFGD